MKHTQHKLTLSEQQQLEAFIAKDSRIKAINKNFRARGHLNVLEQIMLKQLVRELKADYDSLKGRRFFVGA